MREREREREKREKEKEREKRKRESMKYCTVPFDFEFPAMSCSSAWPCSLPVQNFSPNCYCSLYILTTSLLLTHRDLTAFLDRKAFVGSRYTLLLYMMPSVVFLPRSLGVFESCFEATSGTASIVSTAFHNIKLSCTGDALAGDSICAQFMQDLSWLSLCSVARSDWEVTFLLCVWRPLGSLCVSLLRWEDRSSICFFLTSFFFFFFRETLVKKERLAWKASRWARRDCRGLWKRTSCSTWKDF